MAFFGPDVVLDDPAWIHDSVKANQGNADFYYRNALNYSEGIYRMVDQEG